MQSLWTMREPDPTWNHPPRSNYKSREGENCVKSNPSFKACRFSSRRQLHRPLGYVKLRPGIAFAAEALVTPTIYYQFQVCVLSYWIWLWEFSWTKSEALPSQILQTSANGWVRVILVCNRARFEMALSNLPDNAFKYSFTITVTWNKKPECAI